MLLPTTAAWRFVAAECVYRGVSEPSVSVVVPVRSVLATNCTKPRDINHTEAFFNLLLCLRLLSILSPSTSDLLYLNQSKAGTARCRSPTNSARGLRSYLGKDTWKAKDRAQGLLQQLDVAEWGLAKGYISGRDPKFLSSLRKEAFKALNVKLLYSIAYHPQTGWKSQKERTN